MSEKIEPPTDSEPSEGSSDWREMFLKTPKDREIFWREFERYTLKIKAFNHTFWWTKSLGPLGKVIYVFWYLVFFNEGVFGGMIFSFLDDRH